MSSYRFITTRTLFKKVKNVIPVLMLCATASTAKATDYISELNYLPLKKQFLLTPNVVGAYLRSKEINSQFYLPHNLAAQFRSSRFAVATVNVTKDSNVVQIAETVSYPTIADLENAKARYGTNLSNCMNTFKTETTCLLNREELARRFGTESNGYARKVFVGRNMLLIVTTTGELIVYAADFGRNYLQANLYKVQLPAPLKQELLEQNLVKAYFSPGFHHAVIGLNGELAGKPFGSKIWSVNGATGEVIAKRLSYLHINTVDENIFFSRTYSNSIIIDYKSIIDFKLFEPERVELFIPDLVKRK